MKESTCRRIFRCKDVPAASSRCAKLIVLGFPLFGAKRLLITPYPVYADLTPQRLDRFPREADIRLRSRAPRGLSFR